MQNIHSDLPALITKLAAIDQAGWLSELEIEHAEACRGPCDPLERYPHARYTVERFAKLASRLLGLPLGECRAAAIEAILPTTRLRIGLELIEQYYERLQQDPIRDFANGRRGAGEQHLDR